MLQQRQLPPPYSQLGGVGAGPGLPLPTQPSAAALMAAWPDGWDPMGAAVGWLPPLLPAPMLVLD